MKQELEAPEAVANRFVSEQRVMGIKWINSKAATPVFVTVLEPPARSEMMQKRTRLPLWSLVAPTFSNLIMFGFVLGLFCLYWLGSLGQAMDLPKKNAGQWTRAKRLLCGSGLVLLFAAGLAGCVGYVGPGPVYGGPAFYGPDVWVGGGGFHGHYVGAFSHRGAVSRGFVGHGGHR